MRLFEIPMTVASLLGLCLLSGLAAPPAHAGFTFGPATNLGATVNSGSDDHQACLSPDGLELYFCSNRPGGVGGYDIWVTKRASLEDPWGPPANLGPQVNTSGWDAPGSMSADGLTLYLESPQGLSSTTRATRDAPWGPRVKLVFVSSSAVGPAGPIVSADGLELYFSAGRAGGMGSWYTWMSTRATNSDPWGTPVCFGSAFPPPSIDSPTWISPDGLTLLFFSDRPGGFGAVDTWMITRASKGSPWGPARNLGASTNTPYAEWITAFSPDGRLCYFCDFGLAIGGYKPRPGGLGSADLWQAPVIPIVDFNGDGKVDQKDLDLLRAEWGKSNTLYDIDSLVWGDGVVDDKDLKVFMDYSMTPVPQAWDVPGDVVLTWISLSPTATFDVYLGTSPEALQTASRTNPQGVLVSQGQPATTHTPSQPLGLATTYYWRVDEVNAVMRPGEVWSFTTQDYQVVDDFESYAASGGKDLFLTWIDGYFDNFKTNGAMVGLPAPVNNSFCESTIVHGGKQSLPLIYDNSKVARSEATQTFGKAQDWTASGIQSLSLWFQGIAGNTGQLYVRINNTKVPYDGAASNLAKSAWTVWNIDLSQLPGLNQVIALTIGVEGNGAKGLLYLDDIRLYPKTPQYITPTDPGPTNLKAQYTFEGNANDTSGNSLHGTLKQATLVPSGRPGDAFAVKTEWGSYVDLGNPPSLDFGTGDWTVTGWYKTVMEGTGDVNRGVIFGKGGDASGGKRYALVMSEPTEGAVALIVDDDVTKYTAESQTKTNDDQWHFVVGQRQGATIRIFIDGQLKGTTAISAGYNLAGTAQHKACIGALTNHANGNLYKFFSGLIDDVRVYDKALTVGEILWLAGQTTPAAQPF